MNILDLNSNQKETILLIHPMLSSAQGMKSLIADQMGQEFRYIGFGKVVFEGVSLWTKSALLDVFTRYLLLKKHRKAILNIDLAVRKMVSLYGEKGVMMADSFIAMDEESIKHISHDCAFVDLPNLTPEEQKSCVFFYGSKEFDLIAAKKVLPQKYPQAKFHIWQGYGHCRKITENPRAYSMILRNEIFSSNY